jgi:DNA-binding NarL/FixJ family response regulator
LEDDMPVLHSAPARGSQQPEQTQDVAASAAPAANIARARTLTELEHAYARTEATMIGTLHDQAVRVQRQGQVAHRAVSERQGLSALSNRELEIAELVSHGHTNRQIARTLARSEKTVETHLSHIFTKLGVSSRAAVASAIVRASCVQSSARG